MWQLKATAAAASASRNQLELCSSVFRVAKSQFLFIVFRPRAKSYTQRFSHIQLNREKGAQRCHQLHLNQLSKTSSGFDAPLRYFSVYPLALSRKPNKVDSSQAQA
mmetsp:Transcript_44983/g.88287  ORF Transcript_44983/g.88287 Transcript_44983/m.88287 type:complete len:106 (-) Transcript_44983:317-634(-)